MSDPGWPNEDLVRAAQRGDTASITALVSGSYPHVRRFAQSMCGTPQDAEDATQEALIILYRKIGTLRASGALASWMFRIVAHDCLRRIRLMRRHHREPRYDVPTRSAEDDVVARLEAERVAAAITALPTDQRSVLIMRDVQGYPGKMVADALGLSSEAMKSRLHRARATVRESLRDPAEQQ
jgi:RNA polymerase sigma factor (sigma-70 family)